MLFRSRRTALLFGIASLALLGGLSFVATLRLRPTGVTKGVRIVDVNRPFPAGGRFPSDPYIGSKVCAECHPGESAAHSRSGHSSTLRSTVGLALARRLYGMTVPDPEFPEVRWDYRIHDGEFQITRKARGQVEQWVVDYVLGSGHHATTFVTMLDPKVPSIMEHRLTYYSKTGSFGLTPGHEIKPRMMGLTLRGGELPPRGARECFRCHATQLSARADDQGIDAETMIANVSCERCHGPGRAHVEAARRDAPATDLALPFGPESWTAESLLALCGSCHRHPAKADPDLLQPDDPLLIRFQPVGIIKSKCYSKSDGAFSCVNCHDPHARISGTRDSYSKVCLSCHIGKSAAQAGSPPPDKSRGQTNVTCPVSPRERCLDCHMPRADAGQGILFTNHWIRIHRPAGSSSTSGASPEAGPATK